MNNNFVVSIPKDLKNIKAKLFFGLTKRQLIGFSLALCIALPVFFLLKNINSDLAMYGIFFTATPVLFGTLYTKNGMPAEVWVKLYIEYRYLNPQQRHFKVSERNKKLAEERNMLSDKNKIKKTKPISNASEVS